ncbi:MAG: hypothetical protein HZB33_14200 [Nitrospirae bacterium]|nr:hypothetical protein [Nitrospirota bacterium]
MENSKEYKIEITEDTRAYIYLVLEQGTVTSFVVKLLVRFNEEWHEILRYDSGHGCPHKDILDTEATVVRKVWYDFLDNGQALTMAVTDVKDNHEFYKERYEKWLKSQ